MVKNTIPIHLALNTNKRYFIQ